jgi:5'-nucleotidase
MFAGKLPMNALYNVNIPKVSTEKYQGLKVCRQANAKWQENFVERKDPMGHKYYWLTGQFKNSDRKKDTDEYALKNNFASVVPVQFDLTNYDLLNQIEL